MVQRISIHTPLTWYEASAEAIACRPALSVALEADTVVIGGGLAGLTTCLELTRAKQSVVLLEAGLLGAGASGRNAGFVSSGFALGFDQIAQRIGRDDAIALHGLSRMGVNFVRQVIEGSEPSIKLGDGALSLLRHADDGAFRKHGETMNAAAGEAYEYLDRKAVQNHVRSQLYHCGLYSRDAFHIHPLRYLRLVARKAEVDGARIFENSRAIAIERVGVAWLARTETGSVRAKNVVYCLSALDRKLHPASCRAVLPVSTYIAVTERFEQQSIVTKAAIADTRRAGDYYRLVDSGRVQWGGRITTRIAPPQRLAELLRADMLGVFPELGKLHPGFPRIAFAWRGIMGYARRKMPVLGHDGKGQWFGTGFGGHGLNTTAMAGKILSDAISAGDDCFRRFSKFGPDWAFGPVGRAAVQGSYWWMQLRDRLDERGRPGAWH